MISIIIPVYNVEKYIDRCLKSVLSQTYSNLEVIIVNDGSEDTSGMICQSYAASDRRIKYITQKNSGVSVARNVGLSQVEGEYLLFVDADDWLETNACKILLDTIEQFQADVIIFEMVKHVEGKKTKRPYRFSQKEIRKAGDVLKDIITSDTKSGGGYIANKFYKVCNRKEFPEFRKNLNSYEDKLWEIEYLQNFERIVLLNQVLYHYEIRRESLSNNHEMVQKRWMETILAHKYILELLKQGELFEAARAQYFKKIVQAIFREIYDERESKNEELLKNFTILKGNYMFIYRDKNIRFSTKIKTLWIQLLEKRYAWRLK